MSFRDDASCDTFDSQLPDGLEWEDVGHRHVHVVERVFSRGAGEARRALDAALSWMEDRGHVEAAFEADAVADLRLEVVGAELSEELNGGADLEVRLHAEEDLEPAMLLGTDVRLVLRRGGREQRFAGLVGEVIEGDADRDDLTFTLRVVPALRMLGLGRDTRIFQAATVPEILEEVLVRPLSAYRREVRFDLTRRYPACEYRVQYDEPDLAFAERLLEEEGIVALFDHTGDRELLVLTDDPAQLGEIDGPEGPTVLMTGYASGGDNRETVRAFHRRSAMRPTRLAARHWDWTHVSLLEQERAGEPPTGGEPCDGAASGPERAEYDIDLRPPTFHRYEPSQRCYQANDQEEQVRLRRELQARDARVGRGESTVVALRPGRRFELVGHGQPELDGEYLITGVEHRFDPGGAEAENRYTNRFTCLPAAVPFRPDRRHARPRIQGIQTATVVGPAGEEIHTDEHGRVKVQLHWDRFGVYDEHSSCWMRVQQPWAGEGWGFVFLPRVGMEVTVTFVDGDPDRPLVTGAVYNGDNPTPYPLPDEKSRSVIRTRSTLEGGPDDYNELSFEDRLGAEEVYLQAQRDLRELVKHHHGTTVRGDQTNSVGGDQDESVGRDQSLSVDGCRTVRIGGSQSVTIDGNQAADGVTGSKLAITGDYEVDVSNTIEMEAATHIRLTCGGSAIVIEPGRIRLEAGDGSYLYLDDVVGMVSQAGSAVTLDQNAEVGSILGGTLHLDANATARSSAGSRLRLDTVAAMAAAEGGRVRLFGDALLESSGGAEVRLSGNASMSGAAATVEGRAQARLGGGRGSVICDSSAVSVEGPQVLLNS